jgi:hypothetical protein
MPSNTVPGVPPNFDPQHPIQFPGGVLQTGITNPVSGITDGIGAIAQMLAKVLDALSSPDFWVSVILVIGGGWLVVTGAGQLLLRTPAKQVAGAA